jgi:hypothetical protein
MRIVFSPLTLGFLTLSLIACTSSIAPKPQVAAPQTTTPLMFPQLNVATTSLTLIDMMGFDPKAGDTSDAITTAKALQGLVNRASQNRLYLMRSNSNTIHPLAQRLGMEWNAELDWLDNLPELKDLPRTTLQRYNENNGSLRRLLETYKANIKGLVIWDDKLAGHVRMATAGAAVTVASQMGGLPVSPQLKAQLEGWGLSFPVLRDLRQNQFTSDHQVLNWLIDNYWAASNQDAKVVFSIGRDGWPDKTINDVWTSDEIFCDGPVDYAVSVNGFAFNLDFADDNDKAALLKLLGKYQEGNIAILGWVPTHMGELAEDNPNTPNIREGFAEYPTFMNGTSYYLIGASAINNISVLSSFKTVKAHRPVSAAQPVQNSDVFVGFYISDGDAHAHVTRGHFANFTRYKAPEYGGDTFGQVPISWVVSGMMAEYSPPLHNFFVNNLPAGSDFLFAFGNKPSAPGDTNQDKLAQSVYRFSELSGFKNMWTIHSPEETQRPDLVNWNMIVRGYINSRQAAGVSSLNAQTPVFGTWTFENSSWDTTLIANGISAEAAKKPNEPLFMFVWLGTGGDNEHSESRYKRALEIKNKLLANPAGRTYKFLGASDMGKTYMEWKKTR